MALKPAIINVMEAAARKASWNLVRDFGEVEQLQVSRKGPSDFVSAADMRAEKTLLRELQKGRPNFGLLMEEGGFTPGADDQNRWIVDPLDGTTNFLHGVPHFAISIAHEENGQIVASVIYQPVTDELFWAARGGGAYLNNRRLRVSARDQMRDALLATGLPYRGKPKHPAYVASLDAILPIVAGVRRFGAAALDLAWVAAGRYDGFWEFDLERWDVAAGLLLLREAGGSTSDVAGRDKAWDGREVLASNTVLHDNLRKIVNDSMRSVAESTE